MTTIFWIQVFTVFYYLIKFSQYSDFHVSEFFYAITKMQSNDNMGSGGLKSDDSDRKIFVRFKFKNEEREYREWITDIQYKNLK